MTEKQSLKAKTVNGVGWSAIDTVANQGITFLVGLVLARLLSPDEYGLIGIIMIFIALFNVFIVSGFNSALIRKKDTSDKDYNTMFLFNIGVSIVLFVVLWLASPVIASFFKREELTALTRAMGVILLINAFSLVQVTILTKQINFRKQAKISLIASVTSGVLGIGMALAGYGVWSLVSQQISRQGLNAFLLWIWSKWRPDFTFSRTSFKYLWGYGWKLLCSSLLDTTWTQLYQVVIGKCYTPATLGQYSRAYQFSNIFSQNLTNIVQRVSYPVLSSIQDDLERLKEAYRRVIKTTMLVSFICMLGLAAIARPMVLVLIGEQWLPCVVMLQLLNFNMMLYPLHALNLNMLQVQGRSDLFLKIEIYKKIIAVGPILLGIFYNIHAMLIGSIFSSFIAYYLNAYYSRPFLKYSIWQQVRDILPSFGVAVAMAVPVYFLTYLPLPPLPILLIQLVVGAIIIFAICEAIKLPEYLELKNIALGALRKITKK
ncbi:lipopolysaccharide biosynthesis protein [Bacteroides bouchesdurhonensis]|uniref:lipopolysaccharide biosynthesis protein n=1 Tax=Bacteroides bouchesdurhonensis TaxID=1841855 RepID=UPI0011DC7F09|nr:lipopolysaccharide biosynthesis protein [Bacteroides bouchesdurhonensis]